MPCRYFLPGEEEAIQRKELDRVTRLLCEVMTELKAEGALDRPGICLSNEVMQWWREHQIRDKKRKEWEAAAAARAVVAKDEEIAVLKRRLAELEGVK